MNNLLLLISFLAISMSFSLQTIPGLEQVTQFLNNINGTMLAGGATMGVVILTSKQYNSTRSEGDLFFRRDFLKNVAAPTTLVGGTFIFSKIIDDKISWKVKSLGISLSLLGSAFTIGWDPHKKVLKNIKSTCLQIKRLCTWSMLGAGTALGLSFTWKKFSQ